MSLRARVAGLSTRARRAMRRGDRPASPPPRARSGLSLQPYTSLFPAAGERPLRAVVLVHQNPGEDLAGLLAELTDLAPDHVFVLAPEADPGWELAQLGVSYLAADGLRQLNTRLKTIGPVDLVVDLIGTLPEAGGDIWRTCFFHLRPHGVYVLRHAPEVSTGAASRLELFLRRHWRAEAEQEDEDGERVPALDKELLASCAWFHVDRSNLVICKRQRHYLKLRDSEAGRLLPQRNVSETVTTLATRPAGELVCRGTVVSHEAGVPIGNLETTMAYPQLHLQHYVGRIGMARRQLLFSDATILPGSFRYPLERTHINPRATWVNRDFARVRDADRPRRSLAGHYYHLDCWHTGHFGHNLVEVVARLWGWRLAKEQLPDLKAIFCRRYPNERDPAVELALFTAYGIERSDIVWVDEPVWLSSVVTATPMWQNDAPYFVHPELEQTWDRLRAALVRPGLPEASPRRIFVGRTPDLTNRFCRNGDEVEETFRRAGFTVVHPEQLSFAEQATLFAHAEVVAGFGGSGLYNILYAQRLKTLIVLNQEAYTARYEHLFTMLLGCTTHYFWSTPELPQPQQGWSYDAYRSPWTFDFARNGEALAQVLEELD